MKNDIQAELHATEIGQLERDREKQVATLKQKLARSEQMRKHAEE